MLLPGIANNGCLNFKFICTEGVFLQAQPYASG